LIDAAAAAADEEQQKTFFRQAQRIIADDAPYVPLWYRRNVAIFQPDLEGVSLSPTAEFTFLKDVRRVSPGGR
jgi:peptide/nickel transport system substrate-binding protein